MGRSVVTIEAGTRIRSLVDLLTDDGQILPKETVGDVIGFVGERLVLSFLDNETGELTTAEAAVWEVLRVKA